MYLDLTEYISDLEEKIRNSVDDIKKSYNTVPSIAIFSTSTDVLAQKYVNAKVMKAMEYGIDSTVYRINPDYMPLEEFLEKVKNCSEDGIIIQYPFCYKDINFDEKILDNIDYRKDIEGLGKESCLALYRYGNSHAHHLPCTAAGIAAYLKYYFGDEGLENKNVAVIGRSKIIGKPISHLLDSYNCTVTVCHSHTDDLSIYTENADIIVCAVGKQGIINENTRLKENCFIVDVGINRDDNGKICGDVAREIGEHPDYLVTPVPGGVGKLMVLRLMKNTVNAFKLIRG